MRDDYDDYDTKSSGRSPVIWLVVFAALAGFVGLGWYAFDATDYSGNPSEIVTLDSIDDPYKFEPEDKDGMEFPHQDKTIYDALDGNTQRTTVEKLYPEPEEPVIAEPTPQDPEPAVQIADEDVAKDAVREATKLSEEFAAPEVDITKENGSAESYVAEVPVAERAEDTAVAKELAKKKAAEEAAAKLAADKKAEQEKQAAKAEAAKIAAEKAKAAELAAKKAVAAKPVPAAAVPVKQAPVLAGAYAVQLGAYKSGEEATREWQKIYNKHLGALGGTREKIIRADLPNGTFYRLRAVGFASEAAAKDACTKLAAQKQACFYAGKQ